MTLAVTRVAIIGAGDLGRQVAHHARSVSGLTVTGFFDDVREKQSLVDTVPVIGGIADVVGAHAQGAFDALLIGIGYKHLRFRQTLYEDLAGRIPFAQLIHPRAWVDPTCIIEPGAIIFPGCTLDMNVVIGANALLNLGCIVAHDSSIGAGCFLSPGVNVAGFVRIHPMVSLGIGTIVIDNVSIASGVRTGAGAVVTESLAVAGLHAGVPARFKKAP